MNETPSRDWQAALAWAVVGVASVALLAPLEPNLMEEGLVLHIAQRVAQGDHLYRDVVFFSGPVPFELLALLFRVFGEEISVGRAALAVLQGLSSGLAFLLARRAGAGGLAHVGAAWLATSPALLFPFFSMYFYVTIGVHLTVVAVYAGARAVTSAGWAVAAGATIAAVALCKQSLGLALAMTLPLAILLEAGWRRVGWVVAGGAATTAIVLAFYGLRSELALLVEALVWLPFSLDSTFQTPYINLWPPGRLLPEIAGNAVFYLPQPYYLLSGPFAGPRTDLILASQILYALPWLALLVAALRRAQGHLPPAGTMVAAGLLTAASNLFPRSDWGHLAFVLPLAGVLVAIVLQYELPKSRGWPLRAAGVAATGALVAGSLALTYGFHAVAQEPRLGPRVPLRPVSQHARAIESAVGYLRERVEPGEPIFVARAEPLVYFATNTTNPTPYPGIIPARRAEQQRRIVAGLRDVRYVVMSDVDQPFLTYYSHELPQVQSYLERNFQVPADWQDDFAPTLVLERSTDRGATLIDLTEIWSKGRHWVRTEGGVEEEFVGWPALLSTRHNRRPMPMEFGPGGGGIDFDIEVPPDAVFEAGVGLRGVISQHGLVMHPRRVHLAVSVATDGAFEKQGEMDILPAPGRRWIPWTLDLSEYGGQRVTLRLEVIPRRDVKEQLAWWGSPRIARRPEEG